MIAAGLVRTLGVATETGTAVALTGTVSGRSTMSGDLTVAKLGRGGASVAVSGGGSITAHGLARVADAGE